MKKVFLICVIFFCANIFSLFAQETFQVRRTINCLDKYGFTKTGFVTDSPNQRFIPVERELQRYLMKWVRQDKLQAYQYSHTLADFSKKMTQNEFRKKIVYFDKNFGDSIEYRPIDLFEFALEEEVTYQNGKFQYDIQALVLYIPKGISEYHRENKEAIARFRYKDLSKLWTKTYKKSLKTKLYGGLECFVQVYHDNTQTISFTEAFEKRYFNSRVETVIPASKTSILEKEVEYNPKAVQKEGVIYLPHFTQLKNGKIISSITEEIDLKKEANFFKDNNILVEALIKGVKEGKIRPYWFNAAPYQADHFEKDMMILAKFEKRLKNYKYRRDTIRKDNKMIAMKRTAIDSTDLRITQISMLEIQSIVEVEKGKSVKFTPYKISIVLPKGSNKETELGHLKIASFKYEEVARYLKKLAQKSDKYTFTTQNQDKITFAQAIEQRLFSSNTIKRYDTIFDQYIVSILHDKYEGKIDNPQQRMKDEGRTVLEYIYSLGK